jgi:uncharacterized DUF497 family protein
MQYEWDSAKANLNVATHGVAFETVQDFDWQGALILEDTRRDYGEQRFLAYGMIGGRLHALVFTPRGEAVRVISRRKANSRERTAYDKAKDEGK